MGDYLKQQYEERDIAKALAKLHGLINDDTQKLSDKLHDLKLSHNRKVKLLKDIKMSINSNSEQIKPDYAYFLVNLIERELAKPLNTRWFARPVSHFE